MRLCQKPQDIWKSCPTPCPTAPAANDPNKTKLIPVRVKPNHSGSPPKRLLPCRSDVHHCPHCSCWQSLKPRWLRDAYPPSFAIGLSGCWLWFLATDHRYDASSLPMQISSGAHPGPSQSQNVFGSFTSLGDSHPRKRSNRGFCFVKTANYPGLPPVPYSARPELRPPRFGHTEVGLS